MPYGNPWDETTPAGSVHKGFQLDDFLRELKAAIRERMNDIVGAGNWNNDAVQPKRVLGSAIDSAVGIPRVRYSHFVTAAGGAVSGTTTETELLSAVLPTLANGDQVEYYVYGEVTASLGVTVGTVRVRLFGDPPGTILIAMSGLQTDSLGVGYWWAHGSFVKDGAGMHSGAVGFSSVGGQFHGGAAALTAGPDPSGATLRVFGRLDSTANARTIIAHALVITITKAS
jgi:hypothetical protein